MLNLEKAVIKSFLCHAWRYILQQQKIFKWALLDL